MILENIVLNNFRQFKGEQSLLFAYKEKGNITVILGENGRGKTGLFRAVMFCLFGDKKLSQDGDVAEKEIFLVNSSALADAEGGPVDAGVTLEFSHHGEKYNMTRKIHGMIKNSQIIEEVERPQLSFITSEGNWKTVKEENIEEIISSIIDYRVKDYFLFDGEKIERLTRADKEQRSQVKRGIRSLLDIDALEIAEKSLNKLQRQSNEELAKTATPELAQLLTLQINTEEELNTKKTFFENAKEEIDTAEMERNKLDEDLKAIEGIRYLLKKRQELERAINVSENEKRNRLQKMKEMLLGTGLLIVNRTVENIFSNVNSRKSKGEIPSYIRKDLIEKILEEKKCICGNELCAGSEAYRAILAWHQKTEDMEVQDVELDLWRYLAEIRSKKENDYERAQEALMYYASNRDQISTLKKQIDEVNEEIGVNARDDAVFLEPMRRKVQEKIDALQGKKQNLKNDIDLMERSLQSLKIRIEEEKREKGKQDYLARRAEIARNSYESIKKVKKDFVDEVRELIATKTTSILMELLDQEGKKSLCSISVGDDYAIQVLDYRKNPFLANISAGQRQVLSVAFIAALAEIASGDRLYEMPLFMDTPFGRLSWEHRKNIIISIPQKTSQWILLATDTEFRREEASFLYGSGKWGFFYLLKSDKNGNTVITECSPSESARVLKKSEELFK